MIKLTIVILITIYSFTLTAQNVISIGSNYVTLNGTKINEMVLIPTTSVELGDAIKEITYYWDDEVKTFTQTTYYKGKGPTAYIYEYNKNATFKPIITTVKSKIYKGGIAYAVYVNCTQKVCAKSTYYDSFSDDAVINNNAAVTITFATKAKATAFVSGITNPM